MELLSNKDKAIKIINNLPNHLTLHQIAYQLEMEQQLEIAQKDSDEGRILDSVAVKKRFKDWID